MVCYHSSSKLMGMISLMCPVVSANNAGKKKLFFPQHDVSGARVPLKNT